MRLGSAKITILTAKLVTDAFDNSKSRNWPQAKKTVVKGCSVQPFIISEKYSAEYDVEREHVRQTLRVWMPSGTPVEYTDRVEYNGATYDVIGIQGVWNQLNGTENHRVLLLRERLG